MMPFGQTRWACLHCFRGWGTWGKPVLGIQCPHCGASRIKAKGVTPSQVSGPSRLKALTLGLELLKEAQKP